MTIQSSPSVQSQVSLDPDPEILERNLNAIGVRSPKAAALIREASPNTEIEFSLAPTGDLVGVLDGRALCSKRRPADEASTWAEQFDPQECGFIGIQGFGIGHHLRALYETHKNFSVILCFEPDLSLLRAVLERVDHSEWINQSIFLLATDPDDAPTLTQLITGAEAFLATGVEIGAHPASTKRLGELGSQFSATLLNVVKSTRTHLVTILAHSGYTLRNIVMNAGAYTTSSGILPLKDSCEGRAAILIAAGPSLQRNLELLEDPTIRERSVIIAVQTMLKPLLERGIKPHFVTALDHHEISKRFYEGLTEKDVEGVRLIVEPKANAAIIEAFPGEIVCTCEKQLDELLGSKLSRDMGEIPPGATVAHLNYYLARYMGCTNIILIGQDLGFTDGQYYSSGAAIHTVWSGELSEHRTLEMFEWERIARMKSLLRVKEDIHGRQIFTDEQMSTYIAQFESDFQEDTKNNIRVINATEGGVKIAHTEIMTLNNAISECLTEERIEIPETRSHAHNDPETKSKLEARIKLVIGQLQTIERNSKRTIELNQKAQDSIDNPERVDRHIKSMHAIRDQVLSLHPGFDLVNYYNQRGGLNRFKVDRKIKLQSELSPTEKMAKQLDRDAHNVRWIQESAVEVRKLLERSLGFIQGTASPLTRDEFADEEITIESEEQASRRVEAVIFADPEIGPLGLPRNLAQPIYQGLNALQLTIKRLQNCTQLDGITIVTPMPGEIEQMISTDGPLLVRLVGADPETLRTRTRSIGQARIASSECWRGSIGSLGCYDEGLEPQALARVMAQYEIESAAIVGSDWAMVDPDLVDRIISRHRAEPERCRIPFSQAVPGIGCFVLDRNAADSLESAAKNASAFGSIGAMLGYIPIGPQGDPIASPLCIGVDPVVRDAGVRVVADSTIRVQAMAAAYSGLGEFAMTADSSVLIKAFANELNTRQQTAPVRIEIELTTKRNAAGLWAKMRDAPAQDCSISREQVRSLLIEARALRDDCSVLFHGRGDPLLHPEVISLIQQANELGVASVELRTDLLGQSHTPEEIINAGIDVLSVDVLADTDESYQAMSGTDGFTGLLNQMQSLFNTRKNTQGVLPMPWIVPRITRCDAVYSDIQTFYDRWLSVCGCAIIDPNPNPDPSDRIQPLTIPHHRAGQLTDTTLRIQADGQVVDEHHNPIGSINAIELGVQEAYTQMRRAIDQSNPESGIEPKASTLRPVVQP